MKKKKQELTINEHIKELRRRLLICAIVLVAGFLCTLNYAPDIVQYFLDIANDTNMKFAYIYPQEVLILYLSTAIIGAIIIASPVLIFEIIAFIFPALTKREKIGTIVCLIFGVILFIIGVLFSFKIVTPFTMQYFSKINNDITVLSMVSVEKYISFVKTMLLTMGIVFELPVVTTLLTTIGVLVPEHLIKFRSGAIVIIFIVAAFITPPDVVSQCLIALPMILLYQISIWIAKLIVAVKRRKRRL